MCPQRVGCRSVAAVRVFGPDFTFAYDDWLVHPAGLGTLPADRHGERVAVVGAGIAGLVAAFELARLGAHPVVYEADRIGGRLRSALFRPHPGGGVDPVVAELGGMRFPTSGTAFYHYVDACGLDVRPFPNPLTDAAPTTVIELAGRSHFAQTLDDLPELFHEVAHAWDEALRAHASYDEIRDAMASRDPRAVKEIWNPIVAAWDDRTFYDFVATSDSFSRLPYRHREVFGQVGFGTGGWDSDYSNSMLEILRVVLSSFEDDQQFIVGGAELLPRMLWQRPFDDPVHHPIGTTLADLHPGGSPRPGVAAIARDGDRIEVTDRWEQSESFDAVLVTGQSWLLTTNITADEDLFSDELWMALDRTRYMQSSKTFVMVDRPFWNDIDAATGRPTMSMTLTDRNTRGTYLFDHGPDQPGVICLSYAWMSDALKVLPKSARERAELAITTLEKIYPGAELRQHVIGEPITVSWEADPNFLGAFKGALPGHYRYNHRMYAHFLQRGLAPEQRGIFLAGDDVSWTPGWAEGAVQTALNAVTGIVAHLGGSAHADNPGPIEAWDQHGPVDLGP
ncbi:MAG: FAD-dependent oxidoreductase [Actinomycetota bacterium]